MKKYGLEREKKFSESFAEVRQQLCSYVGMYIKIWFNQYLPYLGIELNTFLLVQLHDNNALAAWSCIQSLCTFCNSFGGGCGQRGISIVSTLVGEKKTKEAKCMALLSWLSTFILAIIFCILFYTCSEQIARFYSEVPAVQEDLSYMMKIFAFVVISDAMVNLNFS